MPIAAVPAYLGKDFKDATPGMRFGMYLPIWTDRLDQKKELTKRAAAKSQQGGTYHSLLEQGIDQAIAQLTDPNSCKALGLKPLPPLFAKNDFEAPQAWKEIARLSPADRALMQALVSRQQALAQALPPSALLCLIAESVSPFTTGLGNEHPLENGFAFLTPYGLPYLAGSGVKGVVRRAAQELASGLWGDPCGWSAEPSYRLKIGREQVELSVIDVLFGREPPSGDSLAVRGALSFWDVIPQLNGHELMVEIMTPHQTHYYQEKSDRRSGDSISPHDSGQPNPISFLTIPPGSGFYFCILCDSLHLRRLTQERRNGAPDLLAEVEGRPYWQVLITRALEHAFDWLGFGAKTAVGYGAMRRDRKAEEKQAQAQAEARAQAEREAVRQSLSPRLQQAYDWAERCQARQAQLRGKKDKPHTALHNQARQLAKEALSSSEWTAEERRRLAEMIEDWLPKVVEVDMKKERKELKLAALRGDGA